MTNDSFGLPRIDFVNSRNDDAVLHLCDELWIATPSLTACLAMTNDLFRLPRQSYALSRNDGKGVTMTKWLQ